MLKGKLIEILKVLTAEEWKELQLFLQSPYFNNGKDAEILCAFFDYCSKYKNDFTNIGFTKEAAYLKLYPGQEQVKGKLEKLMTRFTKMVQRFIVQKKVTLNETYPRWLALSEFYRERDLPKLSDLEIRKQNEKLNNETISDTTFIWQKYLLKKEQVFYDDKFQSKTVGPNLHATLNALDLYYIVEKLEYACWLYSQRIHRNIEDEDAILWMDELIPLIGKSELIKEPVVEVFYLTYLFFREEPSRLGGYFNRLEAVLKKNKDVLPIEKMKPLQTILRIYAVEQYNQGNQDYLPIVFRLYQQHLENGWLHFAGKILPETMLNIVKLGLRDGKGEWVFDFLQKNKNKIQVKESRAEVFGFNLALYYFHKKEFEQAEELIQAHFQNFYYQEGARRLEIMLLYEQESVLLAPKSEAFKMFIFRLSKKGQLPEKLALLNNNFIDFLRQITHPKTMGNNSRIEKLKLKLAEKEFVAERDWLQEKLEEL